MRLIDTDHTKLMSKALDAYSARKKAIASNISNIDTPGYKKLEVSFEDELRKADKLSTSRNELHEVDPKVKESDDPLLLEDELMNLSDTQIRVQIVTRSLRHSMGMLRNAIRGRGQ